MTISAPSFDLSGRTALVTGAGRGIGLAISEALAASGAEVVLCARSGDEVEAAAERIRAAGYSASALALDVTDVEAVRAQIAQRPAFDIFVNNAGTNRPKPLTEVTLEDYDAVLGLNLRAAIFAAQAVSARMLEDERPGSIINMSSQMGHVGGRNRTLYCASKWGLEGFTKALAIELAPHQIRVNTICPTFVRTPMTAPFFADAAFASEVLTKIPMGRVGDVSDITGAAIYLASDSSRMVTGSAMMVDGGWTAQ